MAIMLTDRAGLCTKYVRPAEITWTDSTAPVVTLVIPRKGHSLADSVVGTMPLVTGVNTPYKKVFAVP